MATHCAALVNAGPQVVHMVRITQETLTLLSKYNQRVRTAMEKVTELLMTSVL